MNCENLNFFQRLHDQRIAQAESLLGTNVVHKLLGYALFLLGAPRSTISSTLDMPEGTVRSLVLAINRRGLSAFEDQRSKTSSFKTPPSCVSMPTLEEQDSNLRVNFGMGDLVLDIPHSNMLQKRVLLLTFLNNGLLKRSEVAPALGLSLDRTGKLARKLRQQDVDAISDQRRGQQQDYRFSPEVKAELIQQFVIDIVAHGKTSGEQLSSHLDERCQLTLSPRSVLHHVSALGLSYIKKSLPDYLSELKKNL
jgi:transposase